MENARELTARLMASVEAALIEREARTRAILEATVDDEGEVNDVRVLRSHSVARRSRLPGLSRARCSATCSPVSTRKQ